MLIKIHDVGKTIDLLGIRNVVTPVTIKIEKEIDFKMFISHIEKSNLSYTIIDEDFDDTAIKVKLNNVGQNISYDKAIEHVSKIPNNNMLNKVIKKDSDKKLDEIINNVKMKKEKEIVIIPEQGFDTLVEPEPNEKSETSEIHETPESTINTKKSDEIENKPKSQKSTKKTSSKKTESNEK